MTTVRHGDLLDALLDATTVTTHLDWHRRACSEWNDGLAGFEFPKTPSFRYSLTPFLLKSPETHTQPFSLRHADRTLSHRQSKERIAGDNFEFTQLAEWCSRRRAAWCKAFQECGFRFGRSSSERTSNLTALTIARWIAYLIARLPAHVLAL